MKVNNNCIQIEAIKGLEIESGKLQQFDEDIKAQLNRIENNYSTLIKLIITLLGTSILNVLIK